ncbi:5-methylcytosine-specific restriction enzyme B [Bacteroidales bacterium Barb6XT]|nr:5-methylcytosine-specific restriction enzyme B [Bacteroidales bacterium Barb6XT]
MKTQYANIQSDDTIFDDNLGQGWFYVPNNVYIIGTMNDIDRSVESFDFAMRRRFTWIEITAEDSAKNMNLPEGSKERMKALNDAISEIEGLNASYHIGAAYFLKLKDNDYGKLWKYHLQPLLKEYLRGMPNADENVEKLKKAYNLEHGTSTDENNGQ